MTLLLLALAAAAQSASPRAVQGPASLAEAEARYADLAATGGWPALPDGTALEPGTFHARIEILRRRLVREGYAVDGGDGAPDYYDDRLAAAVRRFQELHGLAVDSVVGRATRRELNISAAARLRQLRANLKQAEGRPHAADERALVVNIPAFTLDVVDSGRVMFTLRVVVGRRDWPTPVVTSEAGELIFAPAWRIPRSIAVSEVLTALRRDPGYLARNRIQVFDRAGEIRLDPSAVEWAAVTARSFSYALVQEPGPLNPLGGVKLALNTQYGVHLHDTPARSLFSRPRRALSHGCVRVEHPEKLVAYLLPGWSADSVAAAMQGGKEVSVTLPAPITVRLVYRTAWVEDDGMVAFREDLYRHFD